jgi:hypothetical protein
MTTKSDSTEEINKGAADRQDAASAPDAHTALARSEEHHPETAAHKDDANQGRKHWLEYATAGFAFVAALGSISAVIIGYWQWSAMTESNLINRVSGERQARAYLDIFVAAIEPQHSDAGDAIGARVTMRNSGPTPAYEERSWIAIQVAAPNAIPFVFPPNLNDRPKSIIGPNTDFDLDIGFQTTPEIIQSVRNGQTRIFVWGRVEYRDAFGHDRFFIFRMVNGGFVDGAKRWSIGPHTSGYEAN